MTRDQWAAAREVILGEKLEVGVSKVAAAREAGVSVRELNALEKRSRERRPEDEVWVWDVAEVMDEVEKTLGGVFLDKAVERACVGVLEPVFQGGVEVGQKRKFDNGVLMRLLQRFDRSFSPKVAKVVEAEVNGAEKRPFTAKESWAAVQRARNWKEASDPADPVTGRLDS